MEKRKPRVWGEGFRVSPVQTAHAIETNKLCSESILKSQFSDSVQKQNRLEKTTGSVFKTLRVQSGLNKTKRNACPKTGQKGSVVLKKDLEEAWGQRISKSRGENEWGAAVQQ